MMSAPTTSADLLDLKLMPAWVNEPAQAKDYSNHPGEDERSFDREGRRPPRGREQRSSRPPGREQRDNRKRPEQRRDDRRGGEGRPEYRQPREMPAPLPEVAVRFLPRGAAFESVTAQIKSGSVAYSVFALARLFLDKPERYDVRLTAAEGAVLHQLGEHGPVATDQGVLETSAFAAMKDEFYVAEQTQSEPIKGNFKNVARCRVSGTLLGPTNHHSYQPNLRALYEQRFSRRMSFQDYQRQIEIVSDPEVVEQWKDQARSVTTYKAKAKSEAEAKPEAELKPEADATPEVEPEVKIEGEGPGQAFSSLAEAERDFRQTHLPTLLRSAPAFTMNGVESRRLQDRGLGRLIEDAWAAEIRSPSKMMQELAGGLREKGLNIFRHRRGMLFVSPIRVRSFGHERASVSGSINTIMEKLAESPGMNRKQLLDKMTPTGAEAEVAERAKLMLVSDLRWLISEGYVMDFNDGTLDLPRAKAPAVAPQDGAIKKETASLPATSFEQLEATEHQSSEDASPADEGGVSVEQSIAPLESAPIIDGEVLTESSTGLAPEDAPVVDDNIRVEEPGDQEPAPQSRE